MRLTERGKFFLNHWIFILCTYNYVQHAGVRKFLKLCTRLDIQNRHAISTIFTSVRVGHSALNKIFQDVPPCKTGASILQEDNWPPSDLRVNTEHTYVLLKLLTYCRHKFRTCTTQNFARYKELYNTPPIMRIFWFHFARNRNLKKIGNFDEMQFKLMCIWSRDYLSYTTH